jgi:iron-sulfur cluster assembly accessory protein
MGCGGCSTNPEITEVEQKELVLPADGKIVSLTEKAAAKVKEYMTEEKKEGKDGYGLRIMVVPGGCAGYQYGLDFDTQKEGDIAVKESGLTIFVDKNSAAHLLGTTVDFVDGLHGAGFKINNPNAKQSCGCGNSFS